MRIVHRPKDPGSPEAKPKRGLLRTILVAAVAVIVTVFVVTITVLWPIIFKSHAELTFARAESEWKTDRPRAIADINAALEESLKNKNDIAGSMALYRRYASLLYWDEQKAEGDKQIANAIALSASPPNGSIEADQLTMAYQDRGYRTHEIYMETMSGPTGLEDQEKCVALVTKAFGPDRGETINKLPSLAVMYADLHQTDKADRIMKQALDACAKPETSQYSRWFVNTMNSRLLAIEGKYREASGSYFKAKKLATNDRQRRRALNELTTGIRTFEPEDKLDKSVMSLLEQSNFKQLETMADKLRQSQEAYWNGRWKLNSLYSALTFDRSKKGEEAFKKQIAVLKKWILANPKSVTAKNALSGCYISYAWLARGSGYADTVSKDGWKDFELRLKEAKRILDQNPGLKKSCPETFANYSTIGLGQGLEKIQYFKIIDECHKTFPTYTCIDFRALYFLLPRWNGEQGEAEAYIKTRADSFPQPKSDAYYARCVVSIEDYLENCFKKDSPIKWERAKSGFQEIFKEYPTSIDARIAYFRMALTADDKETALKAFDGFKSKKQ